MSNTPLMDEVDEIGVWYPYEGGSTMGLAGPEGGTVLRDEEYGDPDDSEEAHARLTLERATNGAPGFVLTATLYGWMFVTRSVSDQPQADADYTAMRSDLEHLSTLFPYEEDGPALIQKKAQDLMTAVADFEGRWSVSE